MPENYAQSLADAPDTPFDVSLRPPAFSEFAGQEKVREQLLVMVEAARQRGDILFIDEIHALSRIIEEYLYPAMEEYHRRHDARRDDHRAAAFAFRHDVPAQRTISLALRLPSARVWPLVAGESEERAFA